MLKSQRTTHGALKQKNSTSERTHHPEKENQHLESKVPSKTFPPLFIDFIYLILNLL